jgi:hypothetical protein
MRSPCTDYCTICDAEIDTPDEIPLCEDCREETEIFPDY